MDTTFITDNLSDPAIRALMRNGCELRSYQSEALRIIYKGALRRKGERFAVTFPRQSGKNETQAQLESALMAVNLHCGGTIVKILPTEKNQGMVSRSRLETVLQAGMPKNAAFARFSNAQTTYGSTRVRYLSASPNSAIVGATADLLLEVDEAQLVPPEKFDRDAAPMAASTNAAQVFWGTAWDDSTLLSRESRLALADGSKKGQKQLFLTDASAVGSEVPDYADFVRRQVESLGRDHPTVRTQLFCEEISDLTGMFTPERCRLMRGDHAPLDEPEKDRCYVFLVDIAGSDELNARVRQTSGFDDRRDATAVTICEVSLPKDEKGFEIWEKGAVWKVAARRYYRNLPADMLEAELVREISFWDPVRIALDHTGLGCMLSDFLSRKYPHLCRTYDITAAAKSKMAWSFISMVNSGRWQEYRVDEADVRVSEFDPKRDRHEVLSDPVLLQQMFFRELRSCRMEPGLNPGTVRWGVPEGTRDPQTGRMIHDDLVMSAALAVFDENDLPLSRTLPLWEPEKLARII